MGKVTGMSSVRVAALNLWGRHGAWDERRSVLVDGLRELQPDIIAFQEAVVTEGYDQVADLLGAGYQVVHQAGRDAEGTGLSIASRWEVGEVWEQSLDVSPRVEPNEIAVAEILAPGPIRTELLFAHHNASWQLGFEHERELQAVAASRLLEDLVDERGVGHVILAGDFNAAPGSASVGFWTGRQALSGMSVCYRDAWEGAHPGEPGHTFTPRNPLVTGGNNWPLELGRRIDYVMVRCLEHRPTLEVTACALAFDEPIDGVWASDHFGVVADLAFPAVSS